MLELNYYTMENEYKRNYEAMKKWNEQRAINEQKAFDKFWKAYTSPVLHPSKYNHTKKLKL